MSKEITPREIKTFQQKILSWYKTHQRDLPWRKTREPYMILLSEVMSQQTQLSRVIPKYEAWIKELPTIEALAQTSNGDVLRLWSGLGYNRRALYLKKTAEQIVEKYQGKFPRTIQALKALPGIGEYTARAVLCFAFDEQTAVLDTNVRRVILTQFQMSNVKCPILNKELQEVADQLLPKERAYEWNQALMDYAAAMLKKEKIPLKKQSPFKTSKRYVRGQIIKLLVKKQSVSRQDLHRSITSELYSVDDIIADLVKDGLITLNDDTLSLS